MSCSCFLHCKGFLVLKVFFFKIINVEGINWVCLMEESWAPETSAFTGSASTEMGTSSAKHFIYPGKKQTYRKT